MVSNMTTVRRIRIGDSLIAGLKNILMDEAMRLEHNNKERAEALMEEIMHSMEEDSVSASAFRPPRPKKGA